MMIYVIKNKSRVKKYLILVATTILLVFSFLSCGASNLETGALYIIKLNECMNDLNGPQKTIEICSNIIRDYPGNSKNFITYFHLGHAMDAMKDYPGGIQDYNKALQLYPREDDYSSNIYCFRGFDKFRINDYQGAIKDSTLSIEANPKNICAYFIRVYIHIEMTDNTGFIQDLNKIIELDPNSQYIPLMYQIRAKLRLKLNDFLGAIQDANHAIGFGNLYRDAYLTRGKAKFSLQDYRGAIQDMDVDLQINPNDLDAYLVRGVSKFFLKDFQGSIADLNYVIYSVPKQLELIKSSPYFPKESEDPFLNFMEHDYEINKVPSLMNLLKISYYSRGYIKIILGQTNDACNDLSMAGELGDNDAYSLIKKACVP